MSNLRTNYKNDAYSGSRKYQVTNNTDGTISLTDVTSYSQRGDTYGAAQINEINDIVNKLDNYAYRTTDATMTDVADNDYLPIYDTSASAKKKISWSILKSLITQMLAIKVHPSNKSYMYGAGTSFEFGHVKLVDDYEQPRGSADNSVGASSYAVYRMHDAIRNKTISTVADADNRLTKIRNELTANGYRIYMDYHDGKYGINTSSDRGAATFIPFY